MSIIRLGVIGCGLIAQVMHLPHVTELPRRFELEALCDLAPDLLEHLAAEYSVSACFTDYRQLLNRPAIDAVLVLTRGDHASVVHEALEAGKHVLVEKPLCLTLEDADRLMQASTTRGLCLMVGYTKWFDPAYVEAKKYLRSTRANRLVQITTVQPPEELYYSHYRIYRPIDTHLQPSMEATWKSSLNKELIGVPEHLRRAYRDVLLESAIHDLYMMRGLIGEPRRIKHASCWAGGNAWHVVWDYGPDLEAVSSFVVLGQPGKYEKSIRVYGESQRLLLSFPSPYLRKVPTELQIEDVDGYGVRQTTRDSQLADPFKLELVHFADCVTNGVLPIASAMEARQDIELMQQVVKRVGYRS